MLSTYCRKLNTAVHYDGKGLLQLRRTGRKIIRKKKTARRLDLAGNEDNFNKIGHTNIKFTAEHTLKGILAVNICVANLQNKGFVIGLIPKQ